MLFADVLAPVMLFIALSLVKCGPFRIIVMCRIPLFCFHIKCPHEMISGTFEFPSNNISPILSIEILSYLQHLLAVKLLTRDFNVF